MIKVLDVVGMHCKSCEMLIENELKDRNLVKSVYASFENSTVNVNFNEKEVDLIDIIQTIKDLGYKVKKN